MARQPGNYAVVVANHFTLIPRSLESMNAGQPTLRESGLGGAGSGDQRVREGSLPDNRALGVSTFGSFPRSRAIAAILAPAWGLPMFNRKTVRPLPVFVTRSDCCRRSGDSLQLRPDAAEPYDATRGTSRSRGLEPGRHSGFPEQALRNAHVGTDVLGCPAPLEGLSTTPSSGNSIF
jgi:hypothetical protein